MSERFTLIGLSDSGSPGLSEAALEAVAEHRVFAGGARHRAIAQPLLPSAHRWITIAPPIGDVLAELEREERPVVVFTSGDPLFYGFGATLQHAFPGALFRFHPSFHSLQMLAHRIQIPYQSMRYASLTGRGWQELDRLLLEGATLIGLLTDRKKTPTAIASRLLGYGYDAYGMVVGEALGGPRERIRTVRPEEALSLSFADPNCVLLQSDHPPERLFGIPDNAFEGLPDRPNMITKMPVRLVTLSRLNLLNARNFWDVGFCTGSIAIEAKRLAPALDITAFERREECGAIFERNCRTHRVPGIRKVMGDFFLHDLGAYLGESRQVDAVFIGGHGGRLADMVARLDPLFSPGARLVVNAVRQSTLEDFHRLASSFRYRLLDDLVLTTDDRHPITVAAAEKEGRSV